MDERFLNPGFNYQFFFFFFFFVCFQKSKKKFLFYNSVYLRVSIEFLKNESCGYIFFGQNSYFTNNLKSYISAQNALHLD